MHIDFEMEQNGSISAGDVVSDQRARLTISAPDNLEAIIFDSANPTGGDSDLAHTDLGNILIISENSNSPDPDNNPKGGPLMFDWDGGINSLFHSFQDFSIGDNQTIRFQNDTALSHIINRVTGSTPSSINGILEIQAAADFFLPSWIDCHPSRTASSDGCPN